MISTSRAAPGPTLGRPQAALVGALFVVAALAWWDTERRMGGMPSYPGADLGRIGAFTASWIVMMAAMMFPSVAPTVIAYDRLRSSRRARGAGGPGFEGSALFVAGYLVTWTAAGFLAYGLIEGVRASDAGVFAWDRAGREVVSAVLLASAAYQLTPLKDLCLTHCRGPMMFLLEHWKDGRAGAFRIGVLHGGWCVGCCWALMATLFALGIMSLAWMALVAALIASEKLLPARIHAPRVVAILLLALGLAVLLAPELVPGLGDARSAPMEM